MTATTTVLSRDGTLLAYHSVGQGPGVLLIPGALADATDLAALASALADQCTVHTLDRRGRGGSGPQGPEYSMRKECEDVLALQAKTGARILVGHSYGGLVALEVARNTPAIAQVVVYEPGVSIDGSVPTDWLGRCRALLDQGQEFKAFVAFARGSNPDTADKLPAWLFALLLRAAMRKRERAHKYRLLPAALREHEEVARLENSYPHYREIAAPVLLLVGGRGVTAQRAARTAASLATVLSRSTVVTLPALDHFGPEKHPTAVAQQILAHVRGAQGVAA
jgi:pimeloyl-ACP methyl ester carboxylesterase